MNLDLGFLDKVYRSIFFAWLLAMFWSLSYMKPWIALSITLGVLVGAGVLASCHYIVVKTFVPGAKSGRPLLLFLGLAQLPLVGAALYGVTCWKQISLIAFAGGLLLVHFAIVAKMLGVRMMEQKALRMRGATAVGEEES